MATSQKSASPPFIVTHDDNIVFDSQSNFAPCDSIREIKCEIERVHAFSIGSQLLSFENILLPENF